MLSSIQGAPGFPGADGAPGERGPAVSTTVVGYMGQNVQNKRH